MTKVDAELLLEIKMKEVRVRSVARVASRRAVSSSIVDTPERSLTYDGQA